jgi:ribosome-associated toxin RatA of RatAB toxin-antitoxin module
MRRVAVTARSKGMSLDEVFARITDLERYPEMCADVHSVEVAEDAHGTTSKWSVEFRDGILEWTELDLLDGAARSMTFELIDGDFDHFEGDWRITGEDGAAIVAFQAELDLGMASLADIVDPMAQRSLENSLVTILLALLGDGTIIAIEGR